MPKILLGTWGRLHRERQTRHIIRHSVNIIGLECAEEMLYGTHTMGTRQKKS